MTRLLPYPFASAGLFILWLVLNRTLAPGQILLGIIVSVAGGLLLATLDAPKTRLRPVAAALRLSALVVVDIVRSNIEVARIVLAPGIRTRTSGFIDIPLDLRDPYGLAALACIITSTPGTLWVNFDATTGMLTIHVLDLVEEADWSRRIKGRYERLLLEIFR